MYSIIGADNRQYGPVELPTLVQWAREGRIIATTTVLDHATGRRFLASDMEELAAVLNPSSTVAPPVQVKGRKAAPSTVPPSVRFPEGSVALRPRRSRIIAALLGIFLGPLGLHRYYLGYSGIGTLMLCITLFTCGVGAIVTAIWGFIEGILCLVGGMTDADGQPLGV